MSKPITYRQTQMVSMTPRLAVLLNFLLHITEIVVPVQLLAQVPRPQRMSRCSLMFRGASGFGNGILRACRRIHQSSLGIRCLSQRWMPWPALDHVLLVLLVGSLDPDSEERIAARLEDFLEPGQPAAADDLLRDEIEVWITRLRDI